MDEHDVCSFVDLEDHPELTPLSRVQPFKFAPEGLPGSIPVLGDRPEDRSDDGRSHLRRKPVEVPEALRRDLDLVHELDVVLEPNRLAFRRLAPGGADGPEERLVLQDLEVVGRKEHRRRHPIARHHEPFVLTLGSVDELREMCLRLRECNRLGHNWSGS